MKNLTKIKEEFLYTIWKSDSILNTMTSINGDKIEIVSKGVLNNTEEGPDFKNAKVRINGITYVGDIEIDSNISDWLTHGHYLSKRYNKVILHLFVFRDNPKIVPYVESGRKVEAVNISNFLTEEMREAIRKAINSQKENKMFYMPCKELNHLMPENEKLEFLKMLGMKRFEKKCNKFVDRLKEIRFENELKSRQIKEPLINYSPDKEFYLKELKQDELKEETYWQQLFYENLFEALGYTKNKDIFRELSNEVNLTFLRHFAPKEDFNLFAEFIFFKVSNMLPDNVKSNDEKVLNYKNEMDEYWKRVGNSFDGLILNREKWHFYQIRPQNFPTIRLAGGVRLLKEVIYNNLLGRILNEFEKVNHINSLLNTLRKMLIVRADGFWKYYYNFDIKCEQPLNYFIGSTRAEEIILNVVLPFVKVFNTIFYNKKLCQKVDMLYRTLYQKTENQLVAQLSVNLSIERFQNQSIFQQGLIELFRDYCSKKRCRECKIGEKAFS